MIRFATLSYRNQMGVLAVIGFGGNMLCAFADVCARFTQDPWTMPAMTLCGVFCVSVALVLMLDISLTRDQRRTPLQSFHVREDAGRFNL